METGKRHLLIIFFLVAICPVLSSAKGDTTRHQIGINMGEFIPLFKTQTTNFDLNYRLRISQKYALRSAINYDQKDNNVGHVIMDIKAGIDRILKEFSKFNVYSGSDFSFGIEKYKIDQRSTISYGASLFFGIQYRPIKNFSISTEPGFYWCFKELRDPKSFNTKYYDWHELGIKNIGHLLLSVHF